MARVVVDPAAQAHIDALCDRLADRVAHAIASDARRYAPVDTGALRAGIDSEPAVNGHARVGASRDVPGDDPHVPTYVELGTRNMAAEPYLRPAAYQKRAV